MNNQEIYEQIQALESELSKLKEELNKQEKFEFKYVDGKTFVIGSYDITKSNANVPYHKENFRYRQTEDNAQADLQIQKELMCIGGIAEQLDPEYKSKVSWGERKFNYFIAYSNGVKNYCVFFVDNDVRTLGVVYMPKDVAEKVCKILNNKGAEL